MCLCADSAVFGHLGPWAKWPGMRRPNLLQFSTKSNFFFFEFGGPKIWAFPVGLKPGLNWLQPRAGSDFRGEWIDGALNGI